MAYAVITRSDPGEYAAALMRFDLTLAEMPVTRAEPVAHRIDGSYELVAIASARVATAVAASLGRGPGPAYWAIGAATHKALAEHGIKSHVPAGVVDGASLAAAIIAARKAAGKSLAGVRVLVPRAEDGRPELSDGLRAAGAIVDDVIVYRTVPVAPDAPSVGKGRALILTGEAAVVVVLAPSQVRALAAIAGPLRAARTIFIAIGETTAAALRDEGVAPIVAQTPTPAGIATALAAVYPKRT